MKYLFETPEITVQSFDVEDIIATSGGISGSAPDSDDSEFGWSFTMDFSHRKALQGLLERYFK